ncbi:hypothetical protein Trydic_g21921 [Trypoxylus dichotomus]
MIGQVADSLATPASGWAIDRIGHPKAWHLAGSICVTIGFSSIFSINPSQSHWWYIIAFGSLVIFFQIGWAIVQISHLSVIPTLAKDYTYSSDLTAIRYTATVLSNIAVYFLTWLILGYNEAPTNIGPEDSTKFKELVLSTTIIGIFASVVFYIGVQFDKEDPNGIPSKSSVENKFPQETNNISGKHFLKSFSIYLVSLMYMSSRLYTVLNLIYIPLFLEERSNNDQKQIEVVRSSIATIPLTSFCASFIASIFLNYKSKFVNDKMVYFVGSILCLAGSIWIAFGIPLGSYNLMYAIVCLTGMGSSATMVSSLCLTAHFVKINGCQSASVYSIVTFTDKLISGVVVLLIQYLQCNPKELCPNYYEHVLAYACSTAAFLGMISLSLLHYRRLNINKN